MALDTLEAIRAFCRVVETGSFTQAAESLHIATTTLSGQIQTFEKNLGVKLLHRTTRKVSPTNDGAQYYQQILPLLKALDEANQSIRQEKVSGVLNVEMPSPVADYLVIPNLPSFFSAYPDIKLEIGSSERVVDLVKEQVDCAVRGGVLADDTLVSKRVGQMPFCLCATPEYLAGNPPILCLDDLHQHRYLAFKFAATGKIGQILPKDGEPFNPPFSQTFNNAQSYYLGVLAGLGVGYIPRVVAEPYFQSGKLQEILPSLDFHAMPMSFVYPYSRYVPKRVKLFQAWLEGVILGDEMWRV